MDAMHVTELKASTLEHLQGWAQEGQTLVRSARALGIDASTLAAFEGKAAPAHPASTTTTTRRRSSRARRGGNGASALQTPQILEALRANPGTTRKRLAEILGVSDTTLARQMAALEQSQQVRREGTRAQTTWFAQDPVVA